jgi:hypothetical protein
MNKLLAGVVVGLLILSGGWCVAQAQDGGGWQAPPPPYPCCQNWGSED